MCDEALRNKNQWKKYTTASTLHGPIDSKSSKKKRKKRKKQYFDKIICHDLPKQKKKKKKRKKNPQHNVLRIDSCLAAVLDIILIFYENSHLSLDDTDLISVLLSFFIRHLSPIPVHSWTGFNIILLLWTKYSFCTSRW